MKNFGGNALKFNPKRGTIEEFQKRDELIAMVAPMVPHGDESGTGRGRRRGRPRKREHYSPADEMEDEPIGESSPFGGHSMLDNSYSAPNSKRKPGRPRKIAESGGGQASFMVDGAALGNYLRPRGASKRDTQSPLPNGVAPTTASGNFFSSNSIFPPLLETRSFSPFAGFFVRLIV